jgi:serine/threonine-protein kinase
MSPDDAPSSAAPVRDERVLAGRYRLERRIGQGGMAEVWVAVDEQLDRRVAVKWLRPNLATDPVVAERFRREAIAVAGLNHPNIVSVHDVFEHDGRQAVVMQLVEGRSLRQLLDNQKKLGPELTIHIGASVAGALDAAHQAGFVHRDVKPGNILITEDGRVLLTDFGIAKGLDGNTGEDLTSDNVMMGTAKYLSPEQVRGHKLDGRADLYSLALVLYECLAGRVPFLGQSDADTALARLQRDPTDLAHLRPTLPIGLVNLIHRTLARNPAHRPATGADLRRELIAVDTTPPHIDGTPAEPPAMRVRPTRPDDSGRVARTGTAAPTGTTTVSPVSGQPSIPGQPAHPPVRIPAPELFDAAEHTGTVTRATPSRRSITLVVTAIVVALVAVLAVVTLGAADGTPDSTGVTDLPAETTAAPAIVDATDPTVVIDSEAELSGLERPLGELGGLTITAWDPFGDNGGENDAQAGLALADGSRSTAWSTECYLDRYMGPKPGVGLVLTLPAASAGRIEFEVLNAPFQVDVLTSSAAVAPTVFDEWTVVGPTSFASEAGVVGVDIPDPVSHIVVWLKELGADEACSSTNPYRGRIGEVRWSADD